MPDLFTSGAGLHQTARLNTRNPFVGGTKLEKSGGFCNAAEDVEVLWGRIGRIVQLKNSIVTISSARDAESVSDPPPQARFRRPGVRLRIAVCSQSGGPHSIRSEADPDRGLRLGRGRAAQREMAGLPSRMHAMLYRRVSHQST